MTDNKRKYYEAEAKRRGKSHYFIENISFSLTTPKVKLEEKVQLVEGVSGKQYEALAVIKNVPVSKYTENANGRIYSRDLWENVRKKNMAEGTLALADHPEDDGSVKDIWGVWHEMKIGKDYVTADLYLVEDKPLKVLKAGGRIGTSSVGYGELAEDDSTVIPDSFELDRLSDIVINPSQGTFATFENLDEPKNDEENNLNESLTNNKKVIKESVDTQKGDKPEVTRMDEKFLESYYKNQVKKILKEASSTTSYKETIAELTESLNDIPVQLTEARSAIEAKIKELHEKADIQIAESAKTIQEKETILSELQEKYEAATRTINEMKEKLERADQLLKKSGSLKESDVTLMSEDLKALVEDRKLMEFDIKQLIEDKKAMEADLAVYAEDSSNMLKDIEVFKEERKTMKEDIDKLTAKLKEAEKYVAKLEKILEDDYGFEFENEEGESEEGLETATGIDDLSGDFQGPLVAESEDNMEDAEVEDEEEVIEENEDLSDEEGLVVYNDEDSYETSDGFDEYSFVEESEEDEEKEDSEEDEKEDEEEKMEESKKRAKVVKAILEMYNKQIKSTPALKNYRKQIVSSKSLFEAVKKIQAIKSRGKDSMTLTEGSKKSSDFVEYKFTRK